MLPFTHEQFVAVFAAYNTLMWPAQAAAYVIALAIVAVLGRPGTLPRIVVAGGLALMWAWTGIVYHGIFFSRINAAAMAFGGLFALQAVLLVVAGARGQLRFSEMRTGAWAAVGWVLVAYAAVIYPLAGFAAGMTYPGMPVFGITPCPVVLFTFGVLLLARAVPWWLVPIPAAWALIGGSAAALLGVPQDWPLLASVVCAWPLLRPRPAYHRSTNA